MLRIAIVGVGPWGAYALEPDRHDRPAKAYPRGWRSKYT